MEREWVEEVANPALPDTDYATANPTRFRFKSRRCRSRENMGEGEARSDRTRHERSVSPDTGTRRARRHHHQRHHRSERRKEARTPVDDPTQYDDTYLPNARSSHYLDPEAAFRESLFDALADDEGADYWENVYGQPIHVYPNTKTGPDGELERMSDEEYASYVRGKMYEKTHEHIIEERNRREEIRRSQKAWHRKTTQMEAEKDAFDKRVEESLRRREERKTMMRWKEAWANYQQGWMDLQKLEAVKAEEEPVTRADVRSLLPWPVSTGKWKDVNREGFKDEVENFFRMGPKAYSESADLLSVLKAERVRWHPDKIQQRYGSFGVDVEVMRAVTAVFQVIDRMWNESKERKGKG